MPSGTQKRRAKPKTGRGGARPGAGRKTKAEELRLALEKQQREENPLADPPPLHLPTPNVDPEAPPALGDAKGHSEITEMARKAATIAINSLAKVANKSTARDSDRIKAAEALLTWAYGKPLGIVTPPKAKPGDDEGVEGSGGATKAPDLGKKAQLVEDARNPDQNSRMGRLLAKRAGLTVISGNE